MSEILKELFGRLGRRYWVERVSRALGRAREQGLIGSDLQHHIDARIKGYGGVAADKRYPDQEIGDVAFVGMVYMTLSAHGATEIDIFTDRRPTSDDEPFFGQRLIGASARYRGERYETVFVRGGTAADQRAKKQIIIAAERLAGDFVEALGAQH